MKQQAHAWVALQAFKLLEERDVAPKLTEMLAYYLADAWEGAWLPDTLIVDMAYGHTYKMAHEEAVLGFDVSDEDWLRKSHSQLDDELSGRRRCLDYVEDSDALDHPYKSHPKHGGHLPNRVIALSHSISDMLKMADYPIGFYAKGKLSHVYEGNLADQDLKGLSQSPNFSARQIAVMFFMLSHYVCDAHMPLHCDLRDYGGDRSAPRLPKDLHPSIEEKWETYLPPKETLILHEYKRRSVDEVCALPSGSIIKTGPGEAYAFANLTRAKGDEWEEMVYTCRLSYAVARKWIDARYADVDELIAHDPAEWDHVTNCIFHDAVLSVARLWRKAWDRFVD